MRRRGSHGIVQLRSCVVMMTKAVGNHQELQVLVQVVLARCFLLGQVGGGRLLSPTVGVVVGLGLQVGRRVGLQKQQRQQLEKMWKMRGRGWVAGG
jgi:hypothetical protein